MTTNEKASGDLSIETVNLKDLFLTKETRYEVEGLSVPFQVLSGEYPVYIGLVNNGIIALSNFRLFVGEGTSFFNVPIGLIESVDYRDLFSLIFSCKDARTYRCTFSTNEKCLDWCRRLLDAIKTRNLIDVFSFAFYAWSYDEIIQSCSPYTSFSKQLGSLDPRELTSGAWLDQEVMRVGFDLKQTTKAWRISSVNNNYKLCETYPRQHIVPFSITDEDLTKISEFRACNRFPSIVWRDQKTGVVLGRSSQPNVGLFWWRNTNDEAFIRAMALSAQLNAGSSPPDVSFYATNNTPLEQSQIDLASPKNVLIIDARSYTAAMANRAKGGGCECEEYYTSSNIMFMNLPNIHVVRKSFNALRQLCALSDENWLTALESTKWLNHIGNLLRSALIVVDALRVERKCVLVHCSDGWDRTPQITALAQIMLDPYYRTLQGFHILVEREWIDFGHKFADRCGQGVATLDANERCPIFLQWIDCVHQLLQQFPTAFQFNHCFLSKLAQHTYSCLFGDFLLNSDKQRSQHNMRSRTMSVWNWLLNNHKFQNLLYLPTNDDLVLRPAYNVQDLHFWSSLYKAPLPCTKPTPTVVPMVDQTDAGISSDISSKSSKVSTDDDEELPQRSTPTSDIGSESLSMPFAYQSNLSRFEGEGPTVLQRLRHRSGAMVPMLAEEECKRRSNSLDRGAEFTRSIESSITTLHSLSLETIDSIDLTKNAGVQLETKNLHPNDDYNNEDNINTIQTCKKATQPVFDVKINIIDECTLEGNNLQVPNALEGNFCETNFQDKSTEPEMTFGRTLEQCSLENISNLKQQSGLESMDINFQLNISKTKKSFWTNKEHSNSQEYGMALNIDVDGLTCFEDAVQTRVLDMRLQYERRIRHLEQQLLRRHKCVCALEQINGGRANDAKDETSSNDSGEPGSSNSAGSFELLSESQAELTLWIPDHVATHCAGCDKEFWAALRKHHCRSCGRVFCHECTKHSMPCPSQQLNVPVRVCKRCYETAE